MSHLLQYMQGITVLVHIIEDYDVKHYTKCLVRKWQVSSRYPQTWPDETQNELVTIELWRHHVYEVIIPWLQTFFESLGTKEFGWPYVYMIMDNDVLGRSYMRMYRSDIESHVSINDIRQLVHVLRLRPRNPIWTLTFGDIPLKVSSFKWHPLFYLDDEQPDSLCVTLHVHKHLL